MVEFNAVLSEANDIAAKPFGFLLTDLVEDVGVDHRRLGEQAFGLWSEVGKVAVEEYTEDGLGNP